MIIERAENVAGAPVAWARPDHPGTIAGFHKSARVLLEDNALQRQPAGIVCADATTGIGARQLFAPSPQIPFRRGFVARPI